MAVPGVRLNPLGVLVVVIFVSFGVLYSTGFLNYSRHWGTGTSESTFIDLKELLSVCIDLVENAGEEVKKVKSDDKLQAQVKGKTLEGASELMTIGDTQSHKVILGGLAKAYPPSLKVISEEHVDLAPSASDGTPAANKFRPEVKDLASSSVPIEDITVWVDPLDATQEYSESTGPQHMHKFVTVMVCIAVNGKPVIGIIRRPLENDVYGIETVWGWNRVGVSKSLKASSSDEKSSPLKVVISRSHHGDGTSEKLEDALGSATEIILAGGAGFKIIEVCRGKASAYAHFTKIKKWDVCAGNAIILAAGGNLTTLLGQSIDYTSDSEPVIDDGLLATLTGHSDLLKELHSVTEKEKLGV